MSYRSGATFSSSSIVRMPAMPLPTQTSFIFFIRSRRRLELLLIQKLQHRLPHAHVSGIVGELEALAGPVQADMNNVADRRSRAVRHHHHAVGEQHRFVD